MRYIPQNTLAHFDEAPQRKLISLDKMPISVLAAATMKYRTYCDEINPDHQAIEFYAANHCASLVRKNFTPNEPLPQWAAQTMTDYQHILATQGVRILHYLLSIITREARHTKGGPAGFWPSMEKTYGENFRKYMEVIKTLNESQAVQKYMGQPPDCTCTQYAAGMSYVFFKGSWNGSFGGKPWGNIATCVQQFLEGKSSMEVMVDTAYTLAHNNGPMFNKGMMYEMYSHNFLTILDIQRSGQIPELVLANGDHAKISISAEAKAVVKRVALELPKEFGNYVDWKKVEKLGSVGKYGTYISKQEILHPEDKVEVKVEEQPVVDGFKGTGEAFDVFPGQSVSILERVKA